MFIHTKFIQICWWCQWCPTSSDSHLNIINHAAMARPTIQISTQAWFVKRQLGTRYDSTSHSTTMPSLCHHYAITMPLCHYAISTRPLDLNGFNAFTFALPRTSHARHRSALLIFGTMMALRRLGWLEQFCATSSRKKTAQRSLPC